jgi:hypothetical protein
VIQHLLLEHLFIIFVDNVTVVVDQVALTVHFAALSVDFVSRSIFVQYWVAKWIHLEVSQNIFKVELGERKNLGDLIII